MLTEPEQAFCDTLIASQRWHEIPEERDFYGQLLGSWDIDVFDYQSDGSAETCKGEVHFARILEGRAVQLVWAIPRRADRNPDLCKMRNRYGTTLNVWNPDIDAWRITWINPVSGARNELVARLVDGNVVQIGTHPDGRPIRWRFMNITESSFRWTGEALNVDGETWTLQMEFRATRALQAHPRRMGLRSFFEERNASREDAI